MYIIKLAITDIGFKIGSRGKLVSEREEAKSAHAIFYPITKKLRV